MRQPLRRYYLHSILPLAAMTLLLLLRPSLLAQLDAPPARIAVTLLPLLPVALVFHLFLRYLRECDELERKVELDALAYSAIATLLVGIGCVLLGDAGLLPLSAEWTAAAILLTQTLVYGAARLWLQRRYP